MKHIFHLYSIFWAHWSQTIFDSLMVQSSEVTGFEPSASQSWNDSANHLTTNAIQINVLHTSENMTCELPTGVFGWMDGFSMKAWIKTTKYFCINMCQGWITLTKEYFLKFFFNSDHSGGSQNSKEDKRYLTATLFNKQLHVNVRTP